MREILFRGKPRRLNAYEWVHGYLLHHDENVSKIYSNEIDYPVGVFPDSVGQYTGLTDKNGTKIFEGDIVKREYTLWHGETKKTRETQIGVVSYSNKYCGFCLDKVCNLRKPWGGDTIEVIGNIRDNPELLGTE